MKEPLVYRFAPRPRIFFHHCLTHCSATIDSTITPTNPAMNSTASTIKTVNKEMVRPKSSILRRNYRSAATIFDVDGMPRSANATRPSLPIATTVRFGTPGIKPFAP